MGSYVRGVFENGTKMCVAMCLINEATRRGEKLLLFSGSVLTLNLFEDFLRNQPFIPPEEGSLEIKSHFKWCRNVNYCRKYCWNMLVENRIIFRVKVSTARLVEVSVRNSSIDSMQTAASTYSSSRQRPDP